MKVYIIGSLRNPDVIRLHKRLKNAGFDVFSDWFAAGPEADDYWQTHAKELGRSYREALKSPAAQNVFQFDKRHLDDTDAVVLLMPAGKSGHLELGYSVGRGKPAFVLMDEPGPDQRWDVMTNFATAVCYTDDELLRELHKVRTYL